MKSFVSFLGTDHFLPGILTLNHTLKLHNKKYGLIVMVSDTVSAGVIEELKGRNIAIRLVARISNPHELGDDQRGLKHMYTKLRIFEMIGYEKLVYVDADMLVCENIECLFDLPHMSSVAAGNLLPENSHWIELNAGLMVIAPDSGIVPHLYSQIGRIPSIDGSDQGFLHSYYPNWPFEPWLHFSHKYNVPYCFLDEYCGEHGFTFTFHQQTLSTNIAVLHYWAVRKPWQIDPATLVKPDLSKTEQSLLYWWQVYQSVADYAPDRGGIVEI